jgi:hypothetical protein
VRGLRSYRAVVEATYLGGRLPDEAYAALTSALPAYVSCTLTPGLLDVVIIGAEVRAPNPLEALATVNGDVDRALLATGLFETFDITGKTLRVRPATATGDAS